MCADWVWYDGAKQISPALAYVEREDPSGGFFRVNRSVHDLDLKSMK